MSPNASKVLASSVALTASFAMVALSPASATAAPKSTLVATSTSSGAPVAKSSSAALGYALNSCSGGSSFRGSGSASLSNGTLSAGFCTYSAGGVGTVNIQYSKTGGSSTTVRFAWEWVDRTGSNPTGRRYDNGSFTIAAGQTRTFTWKYASPGVYSPSGNAPCRRGVLIQGANTYSTRIVC